MAPPCTLPEKRYFTQQFAYVYEKYAKLKIRIRGARPKVYAVYHMRRVLAQTGVMIISHAHAAQGRGGSRGLRPFRRGRGQNPQRKRADKG